MGLFAALLNEELVRKNRTMRNYKTAVVGTGECEIICGNAGKPDQPSFRAFQHCEDNGHHVPIR